MTKDEQANRLFEQLKCERKEYVDNNTKIRRYGSSCRWHKVLLPLLKILRIIEKQHITVIADTHTNTDMPIIYANHI